MTKPILSRGYGIMPNIALFDKDLSSSAKLLYCYIFSLCAETGECRPRNKHLAEKFEVTPRQISKLLNELEGWIELGTDDRGRRIIRLPYGDISEDANEGGRTKVLGGMNKSSIHSNNTSTNKKYSVELEKQMQILHRRYIQMFKIEPRVWEDADTEQRASLIRSALARYKLTDARRSKLAARLKDAGFDMCMQALVNANQVPWNHGENDRGWKMDLYAYLFRNYEMVERWANENQEGGR